MTLTNGTEFTTVGEFTNTDTVTIGNGSLLLVSELYEQTSGVTIVNGEMQLLGGSPYVEISGGVLKGSGQIVGQVDILAGGKIAPGNSPGILSTGDFTLDVGAELEIEVGGLTAGNTASNHDQVDVAGTVTLGGDLTIVLYNGFVPAISDIIVIINNDGTDQVTGTFAGIAEGGTFVSEGILWQVSYVGGDGNDVVVTALDVVIVVSNTNDSGAGSLRQAILSANAQPNLDRIVFLVSGTISLASALPNITSPVVIDASTAPGFLGAPVVEINGVVRANAGLTLEAGSDGSTIRGLAINRFGADGIRLTSSNNTIAGNYLGLDLTGMFDLGNGSSGVQVDSGSNDNTIGGSTNADRNVIGGNTLHGIVLLGNGNIIVGNYVGLNALGSGAVPNSLSGVLVTNSASGNVIGGAAGSNALNIISGNSGDGVLITGAGSTGNTVAGNWIGLRASSVILANGGDGVEVSGGATGNFIGTATGQNMIGGNVGAGVRISGAGTDSNIVAANYIGTSFDGGLARANGTGVIIQLGAQNNKVGGSSAAARNIISGNTNSGVVLTGSATANNFVQANYIGVNAAGTAAIANGGATGTAGGVYVVSGAHGNTIGVDGNGVNDSGEGNVISGNTPAGILITGSGTNSNVVAGNLIGVNAAGTAAIANQHSGVRIRGGAKYNLIGTNADGVSDLDERNVVSGNVSFDGVSIAGAGTDYNVVAGNYLGTDITGLIAIGNHDSGASIVTNAQFNRIGTDGLKGALNAVERNVIAGNSLDGIYLEDASNNIIAGNYIGVDKTGAAALANGATGIIVTAAIGVSQNNRIGTNLDANGDADERNVISGNATDGILLTTTGTSNTAVAGNYIGVNAAGTSAIPNARGIQIASGAFGNIIGGTSAAAANVISGNTVNGIQITGSGTSNNTVSGNYIGMDAGNAVLHSGAISRWSANGDAIDSVGGNNATIVNVGYGSGKFGNAFDLDGQSGHGLYAPNNYNFGTGDFSVQAWVRTSTLVGGTIVANYHGTNALLMSVLGDGAPEIAPNGHVWILVRDSGGNAVQLASTNPINDGNWHNVTTLRRGQDIELYIDGVLIDSEVGSSLGSVNTANAFTKIGGIRTDGIGNPQDLTESNFLGQIDEIAIYGRALSGAEVASVYNASGGLNVIANGTGVLISSGASSNTIGGTSEASRNLISGNTTFGVQITGAGTSSNSVVGNFIGTDITGKLDRGNSSDGVRIEAGASGNTIGGSVAGTRNVISGNNNDAIEINAASSNTVSGNYLGTDVTGAVSIANTQSGIFLTVGAATIRLAEQPPPPGMSFLAILSAAS